LKKPSKLLIPAAMLAIIASAVVSAQNISQKPTVYMETSIKVSQELREDAATLGTLFIILHDANSKSRRPFGAVREEISVSPDGDLGTYVLTPESVQVMAPGGPVPQQFRLKVRLDRDGQGGPDQPGDIVGEISGVKYGSSNVVLTLSRKVQ